MASCATAQTHSDLRGLVAAIRNAPESRGSWAAVESFPDPGRALGVLRTEVAKEPKWADGWTVLGIFADRVGDYALGVEAGRRVVELHVEDEPDGPLLFYRGGYGRFEP